jgi:hypothetical protein
VKKEMTFELYLSSADHGTTDPQSDYYYVQDTMWVTAVPDEGYVFDYWLENDTPAGDTNPRLLEYGFGSVTLVAYFRPIAYDLTISIENPPPGSANPTVGQHQYDNGTNVQVTANNNSGYAFDHWLLDEENAGSDNPKTVTMNGNHTLKAVIKQSGYNLLTISSSNGGYTSLSGEPEYPEDTPVQVTAYADSGYELDHWLLDEQNAGSQNPKTVTMDSNHTLQPVFHETRTLTVSIENAAYGSVNPSSGQHQYEINSIIQATANPSAGYEFSNWRLDGNSYTSNPLNVTMSADRNLVAYFTIKVPKDGRLAGSGSKQTTITSGANTIIRVNETEGEWGKTAVIENLVIDGQNQATTGILLRDVYNCWIRNVTIKNCDVGINIDISSNDTSSEYNNIEHVRIINVRQGILFTNGGINDAQGNAQGYSAAFTNIDDVGIELNSGYGNAVGIQIGEDNPTANRSILKPYSSFIKANVWLHTDGQEGMRINKAEIKDSLVNLEVEGPANGIGVHLTGAAADRAVYYNQFSTITGYIPNEQVVKRGFLLTTGGISSAINKRIWQENGTHNDIYVLAQS